MKKGAFIATQKLRDLVKIYFSDEKYGGVVRGFASTLNIDEPRASRVLNGKETPSMQLMKSIHDYFHISEGLFAYDSEAEIGNGNQIS